MNTTTWFYLDGVSAAQRSAHLAARPWLPLRDGGYEVVPVYRAKPFRIGNTSASATNAGWHPPRQPAYAGRVDGTGRAHHRRRPLRRPVGYIQVTRGADDKRDHAFPKGVAPTVFIFTAPLVTTPDSVRAAGVAAVTAADTRWARCDLKVVALLANVVARQDAVERAAPRPCFIRDGIMIEGAASNIFVVKNGVLLAPSRTTACCPASPTTWCWSSRPGTACRMRCATLRKPN